MVDKKSPSYMNWFGLPIDATKDPCVVYHFTRGFTVVVEFATALLWQWSPELLDRFLCWFCNNSWLLNRFVKPGPA